MSFPKLFHLLTHTRQAVIVWDTDFNHWDGSLMLLCLHDASLTSISLPLASGFQIKYRKDWNDTKSKYTLTETPLLHTAQEAARILDQVWFLPRCLGLWVGTIGDVCTRLLPPFWLFSVTLCCCFCLLVPLQGRLGETEGHRLHLASGCCAVCPCPSF